MTPARIITIVVCLLVAAMHPSHAEITNIASAINKAGRQRMLTQRMLKAYYMIGINVKEKEARIELHDAALLFESQLEELKKYAPNNLIRQNLEKVEELWNNYKAMLKRPVQRSNAVAMMAAGDELLRASHKVVLSLEDESGEILGRYVNIAGRQRMLAQRLGMLYMLRSWQFENATIRSEMEQSKNEFKGALNELISSPDNTPELERELAEANKEWRLFEHGLERNGSNLVPLVIAVTSENLLKRMNTITHLYEQRLIGSR